MSSKSKGFVTGGDTTSAVDMTSVMCAMVSLFLLAIQNHWNRTMIDPLDLISAKTVLLSGKTAPIAGETYLVEHPTLGFVHVSCRSLTAIEKFSDRCGGCAFLQGNECSLKPRDWWCRNIKFDKVSSDERD